MSQKIHFRREHLSSCNCFNGCLYLKNVELPSKMTEVPAFSFGGCTSLEHVKMSDAVMSIGMFAFVDCVNLRDVTIPAKVGAIGMYAFSGTALTSVTIPSSVSFLDMGAFSKCPSLKTALFEDGEILLDSNIFLDSAALETVEFEGKSVTFSEYSLSVGIGPEPKDLTVIVPKGLSVPDNVSDEFTNISIEVLGERPYPYVNLIGVAICIVILFLIVYSVREV